MTEETITIPAGYRLDARERLVPEKHIPAVDLLRDDLVRNLVERVRDTRDELSYLKGVLLAQISEHISLIASEYGADIAGTAGNVSLQSFDGKLKVERISAERITVGEQIHAAESLVREYLAEATRESDPAVVAIVDRAFRRNAKTGQLNVARLLDFVNVRIEDARWRQAQQAIRDSLQAQAAVTYIRVYERDSVDQPWRHLTLDFSAVAPAVIDAAGGTHGL